MTSSWYVATPLGPPSGFNADASGTGPLNLAHMP